MRGRYTPWALSAILLLAAGNFLWQLGSSSFFIDEVFSIQHSVPRISSVLSEVRMTESTPWTYFLFLHEWIGRTASQSEWVVRLPSAVAGTALVGAVYWMARAFLARRGALVAAALCALSPLVLEYAQEARVYVFVMLALSLAVGLTVRGAEPDAPHRTRRRLLTLGASASVLSIWLHYSAALVVLPLCVYLAVNKDVSAWARAGFVGACLIAALLLIPLLIDQYHSAPNGGLGSAAGINGGSVLQVAMTPFNKRSQSEFDPRYVGVGVVDVIAVVVSVGSALLLASGRRAMPHRRLLMSLALCAPLVLLAAGMAGKDVVNKRYAAVAAPFILTMISAAALRSRAARIALASAALGVCVINSLDSHRHAGFYYPAREASHYLTGFWRSGDVIAVPKEASAFVPLNYYLQRQLSSSPEVIAPPDGHALHGAFLKGKRLWLILKLPASTRKIGPTFAYVDRVLRPYRYVAQSGYAVTSVTTFGLILARPTRGSRA